MSTMADASRACEDTAIVNNHCGLNGEVSFSSDPNDIVHLENVAGHHRYSTTVLLQRIAEQG